VHVVVEASPHQAINNKRTTGLFGAQGRYEVSGRIHNLNSLERFKSVDRSLILQEAAAEVWQDITSGAAEAAPTRLNRFVLLAYADLKQFRFYYWCAHCCRPV
jgi:Ubiquitin-like modifier-activating enzyme ATG7 N-terminus